MLKWDVERKLRVSSDAIVLKIQRFSPKNQRPYVLEKCAVRCALMPGKSGPAL